MKQIGKDELHRRFFYHMIFTGFAPASWRHSEDSGDSAPIPIELFWWNLANGHPDLIAEHDELLHRLSRNP